MKIDLIVAIVCLIFYGGLYLYNQFYVKEAMKANEQIGISFPPILLKFIRMNRMLIAAAALLTFAYLLVISLF